MPSIITKSYSGKRFGDEGGDASSVTHLYLNVYDSTPVNDYLDSFGLGIFHSGIEVHGKEYGFGAHEYAVSGVYEVEPKSCPGFAVRRSVWLGTTNMSCAEIRLFIEDLSEKYYGDTHHLIIKNCNHFTNEVCMHLTGKPIPGRDHCAAVFFHKAFGSKQCNCYHLVHLPVCQVYCRHSVSEYGSDIFDLSSIEASDECGTNHHFLKKPNSDFVLHSDKPMKGCQRYRAICTCVFVSNLTNRGRARSRPTNLLRPNVSNYSLLFYDVLQY